MTMPLPLIKKARNRSRLSQSELARRSGTSRPTLCAYEHGRVSPTLDTLERILDATDHDLVVRPRLHWHTVPQRGGRLASIPDGLPDLDPVAAFRRLELPLHLEWSRKDRCVDLAERRQRARIYETVLREGGADDISRIVDGVLLVDLWDELVLPHRIREGWQPLIDEARGGAG
jgi:transcriptional regulator with XRE-family HTH domain